MTANLETPPISVIDSHNSLEELVIKFEWDSLVCEGLAIHNCLGLRVEVAWNGRAGICVECVQSDPTSRGVGECARGEEGGELRKLIRV